MTIVKETFFSHLSLCDPRRQPEVGMTGRILASYESHAVRFDEEVPGGSDLRGMCEPGRGQVCYCESKRLLACAQVFCEPFLSATGFNRRLCLRSEPWHLEHPPAFSSRGIFMCRRLRKPVFEPQHLISTAVFLSPVLGMDVGS